MSNPYRLDQAFKQFSLETERLEATYANLQERFKIIQSNLDETNTRFSGKLAELDFLTKYLDTILNQISQGIIFIDVNDIVTTYNLAAQEIFQIPEGELLFHSFTEFFDDNFFGFSLQEAFNLKKCPKTSFVSWNKKDQIKELEIETSFVIMNQHTHSHALQQTASLPIQGLLILVRDVTQLRRLQQNASRNDRLKDLGELAAHLAHEIRNPLGGIKGFASLLQQELAERTDLQNMASSIVQGADELNNFVTNVLEYARPFNQNFEWIDVVKLIDEVKKSMEADPMWNSNIQFQIQSSSASIMLMLDQQLMKSALLNLFVNAIQAMPNGGKLLVKLSIDASFFSLHIQDTGCGISSENLKKIFSPFFTTKEKGNGLGLAEVQKVIQAHHGWIEVASEEGRGSTFKIKIPLKLGE